MFMFITRDQVKELILLELGAPMTNINLKLLPDAVSPMNHLDKAINETLDLFFRYNTNESVYQTWIVIPAVPGQSIYPMPRDVEAVIDMWPSTGGILQSPFMMIDTSSMDTLVSLNANFNEWDIVSYTASKLFMAEVNKAVGEHFYPKLVVNSSGQKELHVYPPPRATGYARSIVGLAYKRAELGTVYGHPFFVKIASGLLMQIWGRSLGKFDRTMPGGGRVNATEIKNDGKEMFETWFNMLKNESAPPLGTAY